ARIDASGHPFGLVGQFSLQQFTESYDVVIVGAGHAGCEAAMAAARMGLKTALYTLNLDLIAQMSCNPAVGGIAKGHLVREVDALGGIMGEITDVVGIQFRLLNTSRGPAVWSPRAQCDKQQYRLKMREVLESEPNLKIKQAEVVELIVEEVPACKSNESVSSVEFQVSSGKAQPANSVILSGVSEANGVEGPLSLRGTSPAEGENQNTKLETASIVRGIKLRDGRTVGA